VVLSSFMWGKLLRSVSHLLRSVWLSKSPSQKMKSPIVIEMTRVNKYVSQQQTTKLTDHASSAAVVTLDFVSARLGLVTDTSRASVGYVDQHVSLTAAGCLLKCQIHCHLYTAKQPPTATCTSARHRCSPREHRYISLSAPPRPRCLIKCKVHH